MKSFHRIVATGAVGGLAAVTVAASGAFACTAQASLSVGDGRGLVEPGQQVPLQVRNFPDPSATSEIEITWWDAAGVQNTEVLARAAAPSFAGGSTITIPGTMQRNSTGYYVVARQFNTATTPAKLEASAMQTLFARPLAATTAPNGPAEVTNPNSPIPATPAQTANNQPVAATPVVTESTPVGATPAARATGATPTAAAGTARTNAPAPATASTAAAPAADAPATAAPATAAPAVALPKVQPAPAPAELWSGLDAATAPSLLDAPAPSSQSSTPVGGILAGSGILALAGTALLASRRRLALSLAHRR